MPTLTLRPALKADTLFKRFFSEKILKCLPATPTQLLISTNAVDKVFDKQVKRDLHEVLDSDEFRKLTERIDTNSGIYVTRVAVNCPVQNGNNKLHVIYEVDEDQTYARLICSATGKEGPCPPGYDPTELISAFHRVFDLIPLPQLYKELLPEEQKSVLRARENQVSELQATVQELGAHLVNMGKANTEHLRKLDSELRVGIQKERDAFTEEMASEKQRLTELTEKRDGQHEEKLAEIEKQRNLLEEERAQFDLRNNTAVRRDLFEKMRDEVIVAQSELKLSESTSKLRGPIRAICYAVMFIAGVGLCFMVGMLVVSIMKDGEAASTSIPWRLLAPSLFLSGLLVSTLVFYLRWQNAWFREHADWETANRRFSQDMYRASWVAELFFEWRRLHSPDGRTENIPDQFAAFTNDLFVKPIASQKQTNHPLEDLMNLPKRFRKVKASRSGIEVEQKVDE